MKKNCLFKNQELKSDEISSIYSKDNNFRMTIQPDGNLVIYLGESSLPKHAVWATGTNNKGKGPYTLRMQEDGNLVLIDSNNHITWKSNTNNQGIGSEYSCLVRNGQLLILDSVKQIIWTSTTSKEKSTNLLTLTLNQQPYVYIDRDQRFIKQQLTSDANPTLIAKDRNSSLVLQHDGYLVLFSGESRLDHHIIWKSNIQNKTAMPHNRGVGPYRAIMQEDGNFVVYDSKNYAVWATGTNGHGIGKYYSFKLRHGQLILLDSTKQIIWTSKVSKECNHFPVIHRYNH